MRRDALACVLPGKRPFDHFVPSAPSGLSGRLHLVEQADRFDHCRSLPPVSRRFLPCFHEPACHSLMGHHECQRAGGDFCTAVQSIVSRPGSEWGAVAWCGKPATASGFCTGLATCRQGADVGCCEPGPDLLPSRIPEIDRAVIAAIWDDGRRQRSAPRRRTVRRAPRSRVPCLALRLRRPAGEIEKIVALGLGLDCAGGVLPADAGDRRSGRRACLDQQARCNEAGSSKACPAMDRPVLAGGKAIQQCQIVPFTGKIAIGRAEVSNRQMGPAQPRGRDCDRIVIPPAWQFGGLDQAEQGDRTRSRKSVQITRRGVARRVVGCLSPAPRAGT